MPHATHFLQRLERTHPEQTDLALALYRDSTLVVELLDRLGLPAGSERVALSLEAQDNGPWLVVGRDGSFITCLGEGMEPTGLLRVPRQELQTRIGQVRRLRERMQQADEVSRQSDLKRLLAQVYRKGHRFSQEDAIAIAPLAHVMAMDMLHTGLNSFDELQKDQVTLARHHNIKNPDVRDLLELHWQRFWAMGHAFVLAGWQGCVPLEPYLAQLERNETPIPFARFAALQGDLGGLLRSLWFVGRLGKAQLHVYKDEFTHPTGLLIWLEALASLLVLGLRHAKLRQEVSKLLQSIRVPARDPDVSAMLQAKITAIVQQTLDDPRVVMHAFLMGVRKFYADAVAAGRIGDPFRFPRAEDVPEQLAVPFWINHVRLPLLDLDAIVRLLLATPWLAKAQGEDLLLPSEFLNAAPDPYTVAHGEGLYLRYRICGPKERPVHAPALPGRNDPCPCGSGRKYKKCCGGR